MVQNKVKAIASNSECHCHEGILSPNVMHDYRKKKNEVDVYDTRLYKILRPFLWYMRLNGLFFVHNHPATLKPQPNFVQKFREYDRFWKVYSVACFLLHFFSVPLLILPIHVIGKFDPFTVNHFMFSFWVSQCACVTMSCYSMSRNPRKFPLLCENWEEIIWCEHERDKVESSLAKRTKGLLACGLVVNILNTFGFCLKIYGEKPDYFPDEFLSVMNPIICSMMQVDYCVYNLIGTCAWSLPYFLYANLVLSLRDNLTVFNTIMDKALQNNDGSQITNPSNFILRFQRNVKVIEALSSSFGVQLLFKIVMDMLITCLNTYLLLFVCYDFETKMLQLFWTAINLSVVTYLSHISSQINNLVMVGYYKIGHLSFKNAQGEIFQYAHYLFRMTGPTIGISMAGFSVLTKGNVGALIGTYISYFLLIAQFQKPVPCDELAEVTTIQNISDYISNNTINNSSIIINS